MRFFSCLYVAIFILVIASYAHGNSSSSSSSSESSSASSSSESDTRPSSPSPKQARLSQEEIMSTSTSRKAGPYNLSKPDANAKILSQAEIAELRIERKRERDRDRQRQKRLLLNPAKKAKLSQEGIKSTSTTKKQVPYNLSKPDPNAKVLSKAEVAELKIERKRERDRNRERQKRLLNPNYAAEKARLYREKRKNDPKRYEEYIKQRRIYDQKRYIPHPRMKKSDVLPLTNKRKAENMTENQDYKRVRTNTALAQPSRLMDSERRTSNISPTDKEQNTKSRSKNIIRLKLSHEALKRYKAEKRRDSPTEK